MVYSSFSKLRNLQLQLRGKRAPSIAAVLKREVFKVTRREFTTLSEGLQHMELFVGEFFLCSSFYCISFLFYCITIDFYSTTSTTADFTAYSLHFNYVFT